MRYFIFMAYDGTNYHGWQIQPNADTIQERLAHSLTLLLRRPTEVIGAGRTDTAVNAKLMVAHFDTDADADTANPTLATHLCQKLNRMLPPDIVIYKIRPVRPDAHARFSATARTYQYHISLKKNPFGRHYAYRYPLPLNFDLMNEAATHLFDYTDFTSFSKLHTDTKTNNCRIMQARWEQEADEWVFTIKADRFLRNMVRAVVGTLLDVGRGAISIRQFCQIIEQKDRCAAGTSVPGNALFLTDIEYPDDIFA
ncbi:MAG: tRNA pseudouridine(38-40) synthase TruA [Bacteroidaceae bacterium]|nr:tRNA pseudouridine(38-40) synthase TruA [Bacteroidaceae bacterium]